MDIFTEHWLAMAVGIFLLAMVLYGHYRGFLQMALTMGSFVISLVVSRIALPAVSGILMKSTVIQGLLSRLSLWLAGISEDAAGELVLSAQQQEVIENLNLPEEIKAVLLENNTSEIYELFGVDRFVDYVGRYLAGIVVNVLASILLFVLVFILLKMLAAWLDLVARLPIISGMNQIAGALLGGMEGLFILWAACLVVRLFSSADWAQAVTEQIAASTWLTLLYQNNFFSWLFACILTLG